MEKWERNGNSLWLGDCLELMALLGDESMDMIICDLPYGTTASAWDTKLPLDRLWQQYKRVIRGNGVICLNSSQPFTTELINSNRGMFKYEWVWVKNCTTGFQHARNRPLKKHENVLIFSSGSMGHASLLGKRRMPYHPQGTVKLGKVSRTTHSKFGGIVGKRPSHRETFVKELGNYPVSVLEIDSERGLHTNQKPVPLFEYMIRTYSREGDTVLDSCCGSGTAGIACLDSGRKFILIEKSRSIFEKARARLEGWYGDRETDALQTELLLK